MGALTFPNVLVEDFDLLISVRAGLLVVEAQSVKNFMLHRSLKQTARFLQGDLLFSTRTAHVGPTPDAHAELTVKTCTGDAFLAQMYKRRTVKQSSHLFNPLRTAGACASNVYLLLIQSMIYAK